MRVCLFPTQYVQILMYLSRPSSLGRETFGTGAEPVTRNRSAGERVLMPCSPGSAVRYEYDKSCHNMAWDT